MADRVSTNALIVIAALALAGLGRAQKLRHGVMDASAVIVVEPLEIVELDEHRVVHRFSVVETFKGEVGETVAVIEHAHVADAPSPRGKGRRLLCLVPDRRADTPKDGGPFWRATGYAGDAPQLDANAASVELLTLVRALVASERGVDPARTTDALVRLVLSGHGVAQREAAESLRERDALRTRIPSVELDAMLARAVAETTDVDLKVTLASLCAEAGMRNAVEALCSALPQCQDERFATALGRIAAHVHGERATAVLVPFLQQARGPTRDALLIALGATRTESALTQLLEMRARTGPSPALDAALRTHGSARALEIVEPKRKDGAPR